MIDTLTDSSGWPVHPSQLIVLLPALAAGLSLVLVRRARVPAFVIALLGSLLGLVAAAALMVQQLRGTAEGSSGTVGALPLGRVLQAPMRLGVDRFAVLLAVTVALVALVVQLVARWYLREDARTPGSPPP